MFYCHLTLHTVFTCGDLQVILGRLRQKQFALQHEKRNLFCPWTVTLTGSESNYHRNSVPSPFPSRGPTLFMSYTSLGNLCLISEKSPNHQLSPSFSSRFFSIRSLSKQKTRMNQTDERTFGYYNWPRITRQIRLRESTKIPTKPRMANVRKPYYMKRKY